MRPLPRAMATVGIYEDSLKAHLARGRLEVEGILAVIIDEHFLTYKPLLVPAVGGIKVAVSVRDSATAQAILGRQREACAECPECGSIAISARSAGRRFAFMAIMILGFPIGRSGRHFRCDDCQHAWRE